MTNALLTDYANTVKEFLAIANDIAPGDLLKSPKAGEWSAGYVVHHMADAEVQFASRFQNALAENQPKIVPFNEDIYPTALNYEKREVTASKESISALSKFVIAILKNIDENAWSRKSIHPENGEMTITDLLAKVISHYKAHTNQLREIKESH